MLADFLIQAYSLKAEVSTAGLVHFAHRGLLLLQMKCFWANRSKKFYICNNLLNEKRNDSLSTTLLFPLSLVALKIDMRLKVFCF